MSWMRYTIVLLHILTIPFTYANEIFSEEEDLEMFYGGEDFVSIATGKHQLLSRAPAVASVITSDDIKAIGATELNQALELVPGLHVSASSQGYNPIFTFRGIYSNFNPQALLLINGIPFTNLLDGARGQSWGGMPVNNISRIEVIRGPGSAVYGADAYSGVINIITKTADEINGWETGVTVGSFNTTDYKLQYGGSFHEVDVAFSLETHNTEGAGGIITHDAQTAVDQTLAIPPVSLAPGDINNQRDNIDSRLEVSKGDLNFRLGLQKRNAGGTGAGAAQALDPNGSSSSQKINADISYKTKLLDDLWDTKIQLSYFDIESKSRLVLFPPGAGGGFFPSGILGNPDVFEKHTRLDIVTDYSELSSHNLRFGIGAHFNDMYKINESKNFTSGPGGIAIPLPTGLTDVSNDPAQVFMQPHKRTIKYFYAQDEWDVVQDWYLTSGLRYDHYSDFGDTVNPRLALVWDAAYNLTTKFLYGRAFRAPSFADLYNINNPVALGNENLSPETIDTLEIAFDYQPTDSLHVDFGVFHYQMKDIIRVISDPTTGAPTAHNTGDQKGHGLELELEWEQNNTHTLTANYAYQQSADSPNAPGQQLYVRSDWRASYQWRVNTQLNWVGKRSRPTGDTRPDVPDYTTVDLAINYKSDGSNWGIGLSAYNLFDKTVLEPSTKLAFPTLPTFELSDLPMAGRSIMLEASYHLD